MNDAPPSLAGLAAGVASVLAFNSAGSTPSHEGIAAPSTTCQHRRQRIIVRADGSRHQRCESCRRVIAVITDEAAGPEAAAPREPLN
jgi:hypothetical protein